MATRTVKRAYKYRFYPTQQQEALLLRTFGCARLVWNKMLELRTNAWHQEGRSISYAESSKILTQWKHDPELAFLNEVSSVPLAQSLRHLQDALSRFWSKQNSYPRYKSRKRSRKSATFTQMAFRLKENSAASPHPEVWLAKCDAPLAIVWSRALPEGASPSSITVNQDAAGRWYVSLLVEEQIQQLAATTNALGVDMGLNHLAILSTGKKISNPRHTARDARALARAQRAHARKQEGSANREKARLKVARIQARTADKRRDFLHKLTTSMIRENQTIVIEDLAVRNMSRAARPGSGRSAQKTGLNRAIRDASWSELRSMLEYKAGWYGREVIVIDRWFPSSQLCSACGQRTGPRGDLAVRSWKCSACGAAHDRDVNAAKNILAAGLAVSVCGDGRSLRWAQASA